MIVMPQDRVHSKPMPPGAPDRPAPMRQDLAHTPSVLWLWGAPAVIAVAASILLSSDVISLSGAGVVWTLVTAWIGVGCVINARRCGRVHCRIDGVLFPLLSVVGLLRVLGLFAFSWNLYWAIFLAILGASFVPELVWRKYA